MGSATLESRVAAYGAFRTVFGGPSIEMRKRSFPWIVATCASTASARPCTTTQDAIRLDAAEPQGSEARDYIVADKPLAWACLALHVFPRVDKST